MRCLPNNAKETLKQLVVVLCLATFVLVAAICVIGIKVEKYRDQTVRAGKVTRPWDLFLPHRSRPTYLIVFSKTYRGVRGIRPYYLPVPELNSILFVTENPPFRVRFYIVDLQTKEATEIEAGTSGFGGNIGAPRPPGAYYTDYVRSANPNKLLLVERTDRWETITTLNLQKRAIEQIESLSFDAHGEVTNRWVLRP
jgi:hypothetical protein